MGLAMHAKLTSYLWSSYSCLIMAGFIKCADVSDNNISTEIKNSVFVNLVYFYLDTYKFYVNMYSTQRNYLNSS